MHQTFATDRDLAEARPISRFLEGLSGWVLEPLLTLDRHRPGVLAEVLGARSRKRQAIYAALAAGALKRPQEFAELLGQGGSWHGAVWPALLAEALISADPQAIVATAYGSAPDGYLTLLAHAGAAPLRADAYVRLHRVYADPAQSRRQRVLSDLMRLTDSKLDIVEILPIEALRQSVLGACRSADDARVVAFAVGLALQRGRSRVEVAKQLSDIGRVSSCFGVVKALIENFGEAPSSPDLSMISGAEVLTSSDALRRAQRDLEVCLGSIPVAWATSTGEIVYAILHEQKLIVQLHALSAGWIVSAIHKPGNVAVLAADRHVACALFEGAGFPILASLRRGDDAQLVGAMMDGVQAQLARLLD